eukprot:NODE_6442_length_570_cov_20.115163_g6028_i0.p1 GENE.NODE_6442_length_570_cov_20.115163_g6028_i0~~NODE_6442_length_570_cov_20.115163_g6028_i0.p1  ORF type:complete len:133 (+),score=31.89 NODE_6442_length_570_cov_20.115163_g6028_i0:98-496(+)
MHQKEQQPNSSDFPDDSSYEDDEFETFVEGMTEEAAAVDTPQEYVEIAARPTWLLEMELDSMVASRPTQHTTEVQTPEQTMETALALAARQTPGPERLLSLLAVTCGIVDQCIETNQLAIEKLEQRAASAVS